MDDTMRIKSGALRGRELMPRLDYARTENGKKLGSELGYQTEEEALYIGTPKENKRLCGVSDVERIKSLEAKVTSLEGQISTIMARLEASEAPTE